MKTMFGGRLRAKQAHPPSWTDLTKLANEKLAFIYQRLSSHEQIKKSIYSIKAQDALANLAKEDGYKDEQIYVENRDLGISGTKGREDRPGLAYLIEQIEAGRIESVYVIHISRLYRDQTLINAFALGELFKEHNVIIVTPYMRLNLRDKMHMRLYRMEVERAADELELMSQRLYGAKVLKAKSGHYTGEKMPTGYIVDERKTLTDGKPNPNYHFRKIYKPHADVVKIIFHQLAIPGITPIKVVQYCQKNGISFPPFPAELDTKANRKTFAKGRKDADGNWLVTLERVKSIACNPAYIGWKIWEGEVISKETYPPIIDEATFWIVQKRFNNKQSGHESPKQNLDPLPLAHLLYCGNHDTEEKMSYSNREIHKGDSCYTCADPQLRRYCVNISVNILQPIEEAVISQITIPNLAKKVLNKLTDEYQQAKEKAASYRREIKRLETEIENFRGNLAMGVLEVENLTWIDEQIRQRLTRIRELADLEKKPAGVMGEPLPGQADVELVQSFLDNLHERWPTLPNGLKNAFLRLLLEKVVIQHSKRTVTAKFIWRVGLEQEIVIHRWSTGYRPNWTKDEEAILKEHYATADKDDLLAMLPNRKWSGILLKANRLNLSRPDAYKPQNPPYTPEEDAVVRSYYAGEIDQDEAEELIGRDIYSIRGRAKTLKLGKRKSRIRWEWISITDEESSKSRHNRRC